MVREPRCITSFTTTLNSPLPPYRWVLCLLYLSIFPHDGSFYVDTWLAHRTFGQMLLWVFLWAHFWMRSTFKLVDWISRLPSLMWNGPHPSHWKSKERKRLTHLCVQEKSSHLTALQLKHQLFLLPSDSSRNIDPSWVLSLWLSDWNCHQLSCISNLPNSPYRSWDCLHNCI